MRVDCISKRFRGFLPVVIDVETAGFNANTDALLEIAAIFLNIDRHGQLVKDDYVHFHIQPFAGANMELSALEFIGVDPHHPFRYALPESEAMKQLCQQTKEKVNQHQCTRAILVGHNASFDLSFLLAAFQRLKLKNPPYHSFTTFDTATLAALIYGQTVLAKALYAADIEFDPEQAHGALYDAEKTAELFCKIVNLWSLSQPSLR